MESITKKLVKTLTKIIFLSLLLGVLSGCADLSTTTEMTTTMPTTTSPTTTEARPTITPRPTI
ncbi:MAG TPA: hypothetical protein DCM45_01730, partial [Clostridiales bacterium]|nr:hypothetical protein [Clostridiales bacterium]